MFPCAKPSLQRNNLRQFFVRGTISTNLKFPRAQIYPEADCLARSSKQSLLRTIRNSVTGKIEVSFGQGYGHVSMKKAVNQDQDYDCTRSF